MNKIYRISIICGLLPLFVGISIFCAWLVTRADWMQFAGALHLYIGLALFGIGTISLGVYFYKARKTGIGGYKKKSFKALVILLANFPVAAAIICVVIYLESFHTVIIENQSSSIIEDISLSERGRSYQLGPVLPKEKYKKNIIFKYEGSVRYSFRKNGVKYEGIMFGYTTGGFGATATMIIPESGEVKVIE